MNKTGTSTLKHCFDLLSLNPIASPGTYTAEQRLQISRFYENKNYQSMLDLAAGFKSFEDRPWNMWTMYRHLYARFPDSRFILTAREVESWWRSTERWITVTKPGVLERYQLHLMVDQPNKESMTESYLRYNREVEEFFKGTGRLLVMDFEAGDGWDKLCSFLQLPVPDVEFPHANRQTYTAEDKAMIRARKRLKHGLECQACQNLTIVKNPGAKKFSRSDLPPETSLLRRVNPRRVVRLLRSIDPEKLRDSPTALRVFHHAHQLQRAVRRPVQRLGDPISSTFSSGLPERELGVVSCFFNPGGSLQRVRNFKDFLAGIERSGVRCLVVELAFDDNDFVITEHEDVIQLRTRDVLWHKENLLNIGIERLLAEGYRKIAWLDGDIVFTDTDWPQEIARRLDAANLCQVFETVGIQTRPQGSPMVAPSAVKYHRNYGSLYMQPARKRGNLLAGVLKGGQSGFGWAARAELLQQVRLFENAVVGGGDKLMYIASLSSDFEHRNFTELTQSRVVCKSCGHRNRSTAFSELYLQWAQQWSQAVGGSVDYARLHINDMYHGLRDDRGYMTRHDILYRHGYDPAVDLVKDAAGCLAWSESGIRLKREVEAYFLSRREDS